MIGGEGGGVGPARSELTQPARMEARRVARQMTVDFVTINYDGVSGGEDDSSISSSSSRYNLLTTATTTTASSSDDNNVIFQTLQRHLLSQFWVRQVHDVFLGRCGKTKTQT